MKRGLWICVAAAVCAAGCGEPIVVEDSRGQPLSLSMSARTAWHITGDLRDTAKAIDGNLETSAVSGKSYEGSTVTIDLGKTCVLNLVAIDHGHDEMGFPRRVAVATSVDGRTFVQQYVGPGARRITWLWMPSPVLTRYVRLEARNASPNPWVIAEIYMQ